MTWVEINQQCSKLCVNLLGLIDLILTLPASSVDAERTFNHLKIIKNDWRSQLTFDNLSDLLLILLESSSVDNFDPVPAVQLWNKDASRGRQCFSKKKLNVNVNEEGEDVHVIDDEECAQDIDKEDIHDEEDEEDVTVNRHEKESDAFDTLQELSAEELSDNIMTEMPQPDADHDEDLRPVMDMD